MNTCLKYILGFLLGSWLFTGCHYADMLEFNDIPRVSLSVWTRMEATLTTLPLWLLP